MSENQQQPLAPQHPAPDVPGDQSPPPAQVPPPPPLLTNEQLQKIIDRLNDRQAKLNCARCGYEQFGLANGIHYVQMQAVGPAVVFAPQAIPSIIVFCGRCGAQYVHALGILGFTSPTGQIIL